MLQTGLHIFGIEDGEVIFEILASPEEDSGGLQVEVRRDTDVPLSKVALVVSMVGKSLHRLAHNPASLQILYDSLEDGIEKGDTPF
jgi:hypothetical protein